MVKYRVLWLQKRKGRGCAGALESSSEQSIRILCSHFDPIVYRAYIESLQLVGTRENGLATKTTFSIDAARDATAKLALQVHKPSSGLINAFLTCRKGGLEGTAAKDLLVEALRGTTDNLNKLKAGIQKVSSPYDPRDLKGLVALAKVPRW